MPAPDQNGECDLEGERGRGEKETWGAPSPENRSRRKGRERRRRNIEEESWGRNSI